MSHHRWTLRGDAPTDHGPGCTLPDCCWSLLTLVPGSASPSGGDLQGDEHNDEGLSIWAGWCTHCGDTDVTDAGACVRCTGGDAA